MATWRLMLVVVSRAASSTLALIYIYFDPCTTTNYEALTRCLPHLKMVLHTTSNIRSSRIINNTTQVIYATSKAISYTVRFVSRKRPFSTEAQIELSYTVEKGLFRLNFFRRRIPTGGSSRKPQSKKFYMCFLNRSHRSFHHQTHIHTATRPHTITRYHTAVSYKALTADAGVAITAVASRSKAAWRIPSSARQQRVSHDGSSARYRSNAANNGCACCSFGGSRRSATPRT